MKTSIWIVIIAFCLCACNKDKLRGDAKHLPGKWEAEYMIKPQMDTVFFIPGSKIDCAYAVVEYDYSSGFELKNDLTGDLIWCGGHKNQEFTWSYQRGELVIEEDDRKAILFVNEISENEMDIISKGIFYHMIKD